MPTSTEKRVRFIELWGSLCQHAKLDGIEFIVWAFNRTPEQQNQLYQIGRTQPGKVVTNCDGYKKPGSHVLWLAIDIGIIKNGQIEWAHVPEYDDLGEYWESIGGVWGGRWSSLGDIFHFEYQGT